MSVSRLVGRGGTRRRQGGRTRWSPALVNVVGLLGLTFLMGGSSRADVWSLPILRAAAVLSLFYGIWMLSWEDLKQHRYLAAMSALIVGLTALHLVLLPPLIWRELPGRDIIVEIDRAAGLTGTWHAISMAPELTWNALFATIIPLAILVNAIRLSAAEQRVVKLAVLAGAGATMILALLQIVGGGAPAFYLYRQSSFGEPSGLFSNRNHEALFLAMMLPLMGYLLATREQASRRGEATRFLTVAGVLTTTAFIVILGSRAGLVAGLFGLITSGFIVLTAGDRRESRAVSRVQVAIGAAVTAAILAIGFWAIAAGSARSIDRVFQGEDKGELRWAIWPVIQDAIPRFMPVGTGVGTYERVFRMLEPDAILRPTYSNHAHNDWLEVMLTAGVPGAVLALAAILGFVVAAVRVRALGQGRTQAAGCTGLVIVFIAAIGGIIDYPLRTPILSTLFALACVWVASSLRPTRHDKDDASTGRAMFEKRLRA